MIVARIFPLDWNARYNLSNDFFPLASALYWGQTIPSDSVRFLISGTVQLHIPREILHLAPQDSDFPVTYRRPLSMPCCKRGDRCNLGGRSVGWPKRRGPLADVYLAGSVPPECQGTLNGTPRR